MSETPDNATDTLQPPSWLSGEAATWWRDMVETYAGFEEEPHSLAILNEAAVQLMRLESYRTILADVGPCVRDRFNQLRENPAAVGERAAANSLRLLCRELGIAPATTDTNRPPRI